MSIACQPLHYFFPNLTGSLFPTHIFPVQSIEVSVDLLIISFFVLFFFLVEMTLNQSEHLCLYSYAFVRSNTLLRIPFAHGPCSELISDLAFPIKCAPKTPQRSADPWLCHSISPSWEVDFFSELLAPQMRSISCILD